MVTSSNTWSQRLAEVMHRRGDGEYGETCRLFNSAVDKRPAFVVRCRDTTDVKDAIAFARDWSWLFGAEGTRSRGRRCATAE